MIGNKIKELRKSHNLTLEELADILNKEYPDTINFNKGKISKWENNREEPRLSSVKILADFFDVPLDYFNGIDLDQAEILPVYSKLSRDRQEKVLDYAQAQLEEQESATPLSIFEKSQEDFVTAYVEGLVAAGHGTFQEDNLHMEVKLRADDVPESYDTIAKVAGDSMEPLIDDRITLEELQSKSSEFLSMRALLEKELEDDPALKQEETKSTIKQSLSKGDIYKMDYESQKTIVRALIRKVQVTADSIVIKWRI